LATHANTKFSPDLRERFLTLLERGDSIEDACADIGISRATITKWAARGRKSDAATDDGSAEFAFRFDEIREGLGESSLSRDDVLKLLEKAARNGSVQAQKILLERLEKKDADKDGQGTDGQAEEEDPFAKLPGDELAQRRGGRRTA
jgi:hypothetical protein